MILFFYHTANARRPVQIRLTGVHDIALHGLFHHRKRRPDGRDHLGPVRDLVGESQLLGDHGDYRTGAASTAQKLDHLTYGDALRRDIRVMDQTAMTMCNDNNLNMRVFGMEGEGNVTRALLGEELGTLVTP